MNLEQARVLFFGQYIGQIATHTGDGRPMRGLTKNTVISLETIEIIVFSVQRSVLLRTVEQLTDEEVIQISIMYDSGFMLKSAAKRRDLSIEIKGAIVEMVTKRNPGALFLWQYLLRVGILLPFTYLDETNKPVTLGPDRIIALGWARIR